MAKNYLIVSERGGKQVQSALKDRMKRKKATKLFKRLKKESNGVFPIHLVKIVKTWLGEKKKAA